MIRAKLLTGRDHCLLGGQELVAQWRAHTNGYLWLDVQSEITPEVRELLLSLGCGELAIADCSRNSHPPKVEEFEHTTFILFRGMADFADDLTLQPQQLGVWVGHRLVITVRRGHSVSIAQFWDNREQEHLLQTPHIMVLRMLHYAAGRYLDRILDFDDTLAELEDCLPDERSDNALRELVAYRSRLRKLRRIFNYHQRLAEQILNGGTAHMGSGRDSSYHARRDFFDRCERVHSLVNMYYEICGDLVESHISITSHRLNNTMKVLTIITAIFVPLSFLAGVYGMNFEVMPELQARYGYFVVLGVMFSLAVGMLALFRRYRWL